MSSQDAPGASNDAPDLSDGNLSALDDDNFDFQKAIGGWRGFIESVLPGAAFVTAFMIWGGFRIPTVAAGATVVVMVIARLVQRSSISQALAGVVGVAIGAIWAWRTGEASDYFLPGLWLNAIWVLVAAGSMAVKWPLVGVVMGLLHGTGTQWRKDRHNMRVMQVATIPVVVLYVVRTAVMVPLYFNDQVAILGTLKLLLGLPAFALTLWIVWLMVKSGESRATVADQPQPKE